MSAALIASHIGVLGGTMWLALTLGLGPLGSGAALLLGVAPLLLGIRGLRAESRYTQQWTAIAMVFYLGVGLAETVASQGRSLPAIVLLFASAAEFMLLLNLLKSASPTPRESAE
jgi:uncharacterized membrane protein